MHYAVENNHLEVAERLIEAGANVNAQDERVIGDTPLCEYAGECTYDMAKLLIEAGADPSIPGWMQLNAFHRLRERQGPNAQRILELLKEAADRKITLRDNK